MIEEESLRQVAQTRAPFSTWLGIVILFLLFGIIVLALIGPAPRGDSYERMRAKKRADNLKTLRDEDAKMLAAYAWVDKNKGVARIPIDRAMTLTVAELSQKKPAPAGPIATPPVQGSPAAAPPSPSAAPSAIAAPAATPSPTPQANATPKAISVAGPQSENRG